VPVLPSTSPTRRRIAVFDALDNEWTHLSDSARLRNATRRWAATDPGFGGLTSPDLILAAGRDLTDYERVGAVTLALTRIASDAPESAATGMSHGKPESDPDQDLAARLLVHILLPGLRALCGRSRWMHQLPDGGSLWLLADREECAAIALELLISGIRGYHWRSRRGPANLNLLNDVRTRLTRQVTHARAGDHPLRLSGPDDNALAEIPASTGPDEHLLYTEALIDLLRWALRAGVLSADAVRLIARTRIADHSPDELADEFGIAAASVRRRRQRAEATLAEAARTAGRWPLPEAA
jgi:DNA-directed RNA polymerase specialized sigma24 family protein